MSSTETHKAYMKRWYAENREMVLARMKAWRLAHLAEARAYDREWSRGRKARRIFVGGEVVNQTEGKP